MKPKTISLLLVLVLFAIILIQNSDATDVDLLLWEINMPLFILIISTVFLGWVLGWFTHMAYRKGKGSRKPGAAEPTAAGPQKETTAPRPDQD